MSRSLIKDALLRHTVDNDLLAETLIEGTTLMFIDAVANYLRTHGHGDAADFLDDDTKKTLNEINNQEPRYLGT